MFHPHLLPPPFFALVHVIGGALLAITILVVARKFFRARYATTGSNQGFAMSAPRGSGNLAFDEYRSATLTKLEAEADEFRKYLDGLRRAADASAFEAFLKSHRSQGPAA